MNIISKSRFISKKGCQLSSFIEYFSWNF